jgi:hypothetical protein
MDNPEDVHFSKPIHFLENGYFLEKFLNGVKNYINNIIDKYIYNNKLTTSL